MTKREETYFRAAEAMSQLSDYEQHKLGCVVVYKKRIISSGYNSKTKCHRIQAELDAERFGIYCPGRLHAESSALIPLLKSGIDLSKAAIYVYRKHKDGSLAMARPCSSCQKLIRQCGIKVCYYTTENGYAKEYLEM
jgi:deoxycytidylate deaminase